MDLRELHRELGSRRQLTDWANANLAQFVEGEDFSLLHNVVKQSGRGGHNRVDYAVSIECAKHIAMMEQNRAGAAGSPILHLLREIAKAIEPATSLKQP